MSRRRLAIAAAIPVIGIVLLVGRAELVHTGPTWRVPIEGYDPRDLLRGQYLQFRYRFAGVPELPLDPEPDQACLCLRRVDDEGLDPPARLMDCDAARTCDGWLHTASVATPQRFYIPEQHAQALEWALQDGPASVVVSIDAGEPAPADLYFDGVPWRERLGLD